MATASQSVSRFDVPSFDFFAPIAEGRTEVETLTFAQGFATSPNAHASAGAYAQATAAVSQAGGVFTGPTGLYDLTLGYMDESDGVSHMELLVNGAVIAAFDWDSPDRTATVTAATRAQHVVPAITLAPGDVIELRGAQDGGEPLRTDYLDISASAGPEPGESFVIEAEHLEIVSGFSVVGNGAASGGRVLQHTGGDEARALYEVRQGGHFDLTIGYFDETDGISSLQVLLNGTEIAAFDWDSDQGTALANRQSRTETTLAGLALSVGDRLEFVGHGDGGEPLRLDTLTFTRTQEVVDYDPFLFDLPNVEMVVRRGTHIALLTQLENQSRYDDAVLYRIVDAIDKGWEFYALTTGREPAPHPLYTIDGLGTVAVPERTIGAGGGYLGLTGIEFWADPYFDVWMHDNVRDHDQFDQIVFYELGRNFWFYGSALGALPVDEATSFAVVNRYFAMDYAGVDPAPHDNSYPYDALRDELLDDIAQYYLQDPSLDWSNTIDINAAPVLPQAYANWDGSGLLVSLFARVMEDFGLEAYARMWQLIGAAPHAADPDTAAETFLGAATAATGVNYHFLRKQGGEVFFIGNDGDNHLVSPADVSGRPILHGFAGDDTLVSHSARSGPAALIFGGAGNDRLVSGFTGDTLVGGTGNDVLVGQAGSYGVLYGGDGDDWLGSVGTLYGGEGADTFAVGALVDGSGGTGWARIMDYEPGRDVVDLLGYPVDYAEVRPDGLHLHIAVDQLLGDEVYIDGIHELGDVTFANLADDRIPLRYEAENMEVFSGFAPFRTGAASGRYVLQHSLPGEAHAGLAVSLTGTFDLTVGYFDESDGVSFLSILLNGGEIAAFDWDAGTASALATAASKAEFTVQGIVLAGEDVIELVGHGDGGEPLRVDYVELTPSTAPVRPAPDIWFAADDPLSPAERVILSNNDGTGTFTPADPGLHSDGLSLFAADVDGDGDDDFVELDGPRSLDLLGAGAEEFDFKVTLHQNRGGGDFISSLTYDLRIALPVDDYILEEGRLSLVEDLMDLRDAADVDGDGDIDLLATSYIAGSVLILENDGTGRFQLMARSSALQGSGGSDALFGDFNGDDALDVVVATGGDYAGVDILINDGAGHLSFGTSSSPSDDSARDPQVVDLDGDGDQDVLFSAGGDGHGIYGLMNDGTGHHQPGTNPGISPSDPTSTVGSAKAADFDGDGKVEVLAAGLYDAGAMARGLRLFEIVSTGSGVDFVESSYDPRFTGNVKAPADYDLDGDIDILLTQTGPEGDFVTLLRNDGSGHFEDGGLVAEPFDAADYSWGPQIHLGQFGGGEALV